MEVHSLYSDKGGVTKTSTLPQLAAALLATRPRSRVGLMDLCLDHGHLSKLYAQEKEQKYHGVFDIIDVMTDPRKRSPEAIRGAIHMAVTPIQVLPGTNPEHCTIQFLNVCVDLGKRLRSVPELTAADSFRRFGVEFLEAIEKELRLDYLLVDLPGATEDVMVRLVLPNCACVVIPVDMRCFLNLAEADTLVAKIRERQVEPSGFLRTFVEPEETEDERKRIPANQKTTEDQLQELVEVSGVPVIPGGIPNRTSMVSSLMPGESNLSGVALTAGVYMAKAAKGINPAVAGIHQRCINSVEQAVNYMLASAQVPLVASK